ncbi:MAG: hypothetical protein HY287_18225 [Planctomycetes bacterium]|nr:hypothetical protein [Planctomycetota bacterium]MBI3836261.1 hypothetical protein [Planctomycetota bacterium]
MFESLKTGWRLVLAAMLGICAPSGCAENRLWWPFGGSASPHETSLTPAQSPPVPISSRAPADAIQTIHLVLEVSRVEFPVADSRHARNVWNHLDRLRIDPAKVSLLERNGIRIGVGGESAWMPLNTIFESAEAVVTREQVAAQPGLPVTIPLGQVDESESIFVHSPGGGLTGRTFHGGDKSISLDYAVRPELGGATDLVIRFEIRKDTGSMTWERQADGTTLQVPAIERFSFDELAAPITLRPGEFVAIGIGDTDSNGQLPGPRFLMRQGNGAKVETLLCITPHYFRTSMDLRPRP